MKNVAARFVSTLSQVNCNGFVRISGDSPLIDPALIDQAVTLFKERDVDLVTNVNPRSLPKGQSVEVLKKECFLTASKLFTTDAQLEHVTPFFYEHADRFKIINFESSKPLGHLNMSVDTADDFKLFQNIVEKMSRPHWDYGLDEILTLADLGNSCPITAQQC